MDLQSPGTFSEQPQPENAAAMQAPSTTASAATAANGGPRVSFNRDVHVKRFGKRPSEPTTYEANNFQSFPSYQQLPADISPDSIRKEAALVLAQAERHQSRAENGDNIPIFKVKTRRTGDHAPNKFHSLPTRKKRAAPKPVSRSASDATAKKALKRPSIFSIFSRKSDSSLSQIAAAGDPRFEESGGRRLVRSKSDVGSSNQERPRHKKALKETKQVPVPANSSAKPLLPTQLSPIIENAQKEDYFEQQFNRERRKSEAITDREKHESGLQSLVQRSKHQAELDGILLTRNPIAENIKEKILDLQAQSVENMHSSQLPAQRLPLTKGVMVNGLVKRLSRERFSPPPAGPAFSYIRPNEGLTYAQLDLSDEQQQPRSCARREYLPSPVHLPTRQHHAPTAEVLPEERSSLDYADFGASQPQAPPQPLSGRPGYHHSSRVVIESPMQSLSPVAVAGPTTIRISSSHSPSPWQQLSPRNLSDEDEGLGFETRKYFEEDFSTKPLSKSPPEPPIVPVIRSLTPPAGSGYLVGHAYRPGNREEPPADDLGYRRARLESRILTRRFGEHALQHDHDHVHVEDRFPEAHRSPLNSNMNGVEYKTPLSNDFRYLTTEQDNSNSRFHKPGTSEILHKYSPERSHLDIIAPSSSTLVSNLPKVEKTSRYKHTKYYDDGKGGVKEVYERETRTDGSGYPRVRESRHRERLDSLPTKPESAAAVAAAIPQLIDYEPKSLDSQYTNTTDLYRSSPENMIKRADLENGFERSCMQRMHHDESWQSSLKRDKLQQRSFDKGDSGIENDFRKESFNGGGDLTTRWRKRSLADDMRACEAFLKKERRQCEQLKLVADRYRPPTTYVYRERSIDDGSHYDPHLDKYPTRSATSTLRRAPDDNKARRSQTQAQTQTQMQTNGLSKEAQKRSKKVGGFEKVKKLFTGGGGGCGSSSKKENLELPPVRASSTMSSAHTPLPRDRYMVQEEEMRARYREHRGGQQNELGEPKTTDISMRRRLSTPKASPLLIKRTSAAEKKKFGGPLLPKNVNVVKPEKTSWFKSLDRRSKSKSKEQLNTSGNGQLENSSMKRSKPPRAVPASPIAHKNLRFFGDTDLDSNPPTVSRAASTFKSRASVSSSLNRSQKYSKSAYHLDHIKGHESPPPQQEPLAKYLPSGKASSVAASRHKSSSMHDLENERATDEVDFRKRRHYSRSRDLDDISESGSEVEEVRKRSGLFDSAVSRSLSRERLDRSQRYDEHSYRRSNDRQVGTTPTSDKPFAVQNGSSTTLRTSHPSQVVGPPKPARNADRRGLSLLTRDHHDRYPAESSGTEGESSLHSQRSIVYLHATTVGAIPQPHHLRRRSISRDDLHSHKSSSHKQAPLQPMTRTVSRSVSMLAPWKPKFISEGYEINYSQEQNQRQMSTLPRKQQQQQLLHQHANGTSTLTRANKKPDAQSRARRHDLMKDDLSSLRNSSTTSASKSVLSSHLRADARRKLK